MLDEVLDLRHRVDRVGLTCNARRVVLVFRLKHDFERVQTREVAVDLRHRDIELGVFPQQVAAFNRVADADMQRLPDAENGHAAHDDRGEDGTLAERPA